MLKWLILKRTRSQIRFQDRTTSLEGQGIECRTKTTTNQTFIVKTDEMSIMFKSLFSTKPIESSWLTLEIISWDRALSWVTSNKMAHFWVIFPRICSKIRPMSSCKWVEVIWQRGKIREAVWPSEIPWLAKRGDVLPTATKILNNFTMTRIQDSHNQPCVLLSQFLTCRDKMCLNLEEGNKEEEAVNRIHLSRLTPIPWANLLTFFRQMRETSCRMGLARAQVVFRIRRVRLSRSKRCESTRIEKRRSSRDKREKTSKASCSRTMRGPSRIATKWS